MCGVTPCPAPLEVEIGATVPAMHPAQFTGRVEEVVAHGAKVLKKFFDLSKLRQSLLGARSAGAPTRCHKVRAHNRGNALVPAGALNHVDARAGLTGSWSRCSVLTLLCLRFSRSWRHHSTVAAGGVDCRT